MAELFITPHSLRKGSATALFRATVSFDKVAALGRRDSITICRKYIDEAVAELGQHVLNNGKLLEAGVHTLLEHF